MENEVTKSIFDDAESEMGSLFEDIEEIPLEKEEDIVEDEPVVEEPIEDEPEEEEEETKTKLGRKPKPKVTSYGEAIQSLIESSEDFLVWEGNDDNGVPYDQKVDYTKEEFNDILNENIRVKSVSIIESTLENIISELTPSVQKVIRGELKGVKIRDIINDLREFEELDSIPDNPTPQQKESIVKKYYQKLATDLKKDAKWVMDKMEKIVDRGEIDDEFEDAKDVLSKELDKKIKEKEEEEERKVKEKSDFKRYHSYYVNEALKEENIFGIKLTKEQKGLVGNVLATWKIRNTDKKEKMGITALVDDLIHSENPKESYKRLALMALAAVAPDQLISNLSTSVSNETTKKVVKELKVADRKPVISVNESARKTVKKPNSIFD